VVELLPQLTERISAIARDRTHGGGWLAREAVETVIDAIQLGAPPLEVARELVAARPSMGAIAGALGRILAATGPPEHMLEEAQAVLAARDRAPKVIAVLLHDQLRGTVSTHSASATVREALLHARPERVLCTVSAPGGEGRAFAEELRTSGLTVELVEDDQGPTAAADSDLALFGADTVFREGTLLNKIGTGALAAAAVKAGVPVIVACEVIKLAPLSAPAGLPATEAGERELTPPAQINSFMTEEGAFSADDLAALIDRTPFLSNAYTLLHGGSPTEHD
jgi:translation initiation factor 2B subunit (eIF-2B alpha/beta/delta family)